MESSRLSPGSGIMVNFNVFLPSEMHRLQLPFLQDFFLGVGEASFHTARAQPTPASLGPPRGCQSAWPDAWMGIFAVPAILALTPVISPCSFGHAKTHIHTPMSGTSVHHPLIVGFCFSIFVSVAAVAWEDHGRQNQEKCNLVPGNCKDLDRSPVLICFLICIMEM